MNKTATPSTRGTVTATPPVRKKPATPEPEKTPPSTEPSTTQQEQFRKRQACIADALNALFGAIGASDPNLWDRRAYLMLVGIVYVRLAESETEIPTDELIALAKVLAENRRAEARARPGGDPTELAKAGDQPAKSAAELPAELPGAFGDIVRQLYGTDLQDPDAVSEDKVHRTGEGIRN